MTNHIVAAIVTAVATVAAVWPGLRRREEPPKDHDHGDWPPDQLHL
jgi:hypothetical protein